MKNDSGLTSAFLFTSGEVRRLEAVTDDAGGAISPALVASPLYEVTSQSNTTLVTRSFVSLSSGNLVPTKGLFGYKLNEFAYS